MAWGPYPVHGETESQGKIIYTWVDERPHRKGARVPYPWRPRHYIPVTYYERFSPHLRMMNDLLDDLDALGERMTEEETERERQETYSGLEKIVRLVYTACQFLKSDIWAVHKHAATPQHDKSMSREGRPLGQFRIVSVRAYRSEPNLDAMGRDVAWSHRWKVREHWRDQRVGPGRAFIRPTLVREYEKGPKGAPLDERPTIQAVVR